MKYDNLILAITCLLFYTPSYAVLEDTNQPIHISSSKQHLYLKENRVVFSGDVKVIQGSIRIDADTLTLIKSNGSQKQTLIASGAPATYSQIINDRPAIASANQIEYIVNQKTIYLKGEAEIKQQDSLVQGELITYNALNKEIIAQSDSVKSKRVITIFHPEKG